MNPQYHFAAIGEAGMANANIVAWVEDRVIGYFAGRFHYPPTAFKWDTNVRKAFNFDPTSWAELADQFNRLDWMIQIHVLLAQREMGDKNTIGDLTSLICDKYRAERSLMANSPFEGTLATARTAAKKVTKAKKAKKTAKKRVTKKKR
jgi:hypothetical protein